MDGFLSGCKCNLLLNDFKLKGVAENYMNSTTTLKISTKL